MCICSTQAVGTSVVNLWNNLSGYRYNNSCHLCSRGWAFTHIFAHPGCNLLSDFSTVNIALGCNLFQPCCFILKWRCVSLFLSKTNSDWYSSFKLNNDASQTGRRDSKPCTKSNESGLECIIMFMDHSDNALWHLCTHSAYLDRQGGGVTDGFFNHQVKPIAETFLASSDGPAWPKSNPLTNLGVIRLMKSHKDR